MMQHGNRTDFANEACAEVHLRQERDIQNPSAILVTPT